jgi:hypothetical protein
MRNRFLLLLLLPALMPEALGRSWQLEPSTLKLATEVLDRNLTAAPSSAKVPVDRDHQAEFYELNFQVPRGIPSFLVVTTRASRRGRLTIHLQPDQLPQALQSAIPKEDWSNPHKLYDFRTVVELKEGTLQEHVFSLNRDFFESVTRAKRPFDLAALRITRVGFHLSVPAEEGQQFKVLGIRCWGLTGKAAGDYLAALASRISARWEALPAGSPVRKFWAPEVQQAKQGVQQFESGAPDDAAWWSVQEKLEELLLKSRTWLVDPDSQSEFLVGTASSLRRISGRHENFGFPGPLSLDVALEAARGEYESFQVVLLAPRGGLGGFRFEASDLRTGDGLRRIPSENVRFLEQVEQYVQPSPGTAQSQVGWLPDALLPIENVLSLSAGEVKPVWVTLKVPLDAPAGHYRGKITVRADAGEPIGITVRLVVRDFAIPRTGRFRTQGHLALEGLKEWYREVDSPRIRREFYRMLLEHRFSPTSEYSARLSPEREDIAWALEAGANVLLVGGFSSGPLDPSIIGPAYQWLVEHDCIDRAIIYIGDETDDFKAVREKATAIRRQWPRLRIMVGGSKPRTELIGYVDVWDPITFGGKTYNFDPESARQAMERGEEVFWYTCVGPRAPFANIYNDHPLTAIRALWWQAWKYGITGFEYWWFNWWRTNLALSEGGEPWPVGSRTRWDSRSYDWANGDGLLVYPGPGGQPLASLRLSVLRDAIEDWEVLFQLERAVEKATADAPAGTAESVRAARELLRVPPEITTDLTHWSTNPEVYLQYRHEAYGLLAALRTAIGAAKLDLYVEEWERQRKAFLDQSFRNRVNQVATDDGKARNRVSPP